jgi:hypothetical protein
LVELLKNSIPLRDATSASSSNRRHRTHQRENAGTKECDRVPLAADRKKYLISNDMIDVNIGFFKNKNK